MPTQDATLAFRDDGKMLAVAAKGAWVTLFDLEHDTQRVVDDSEQVTLGAFSGDGSLLYGTRPDGIGVWRVADGAALLVATPFEKATLLRGADGRVELVGDAIAGAESLRCAAALHLVPFSVCRDAVVVPGVLERAMKTPMRAVRH